MRYYSSEREGHSGDRSFDGTLKGSRGFKTARGQSVVTLNGNTEREVHRTLKCGHDCSFEGSEGGGSSHSGAYRECGQHPGFAIWRSALYAG